MLTLILAPANCLRIGEFWRQVLWASDPALLNMTSPLTPLYRHNYHTSLFDRPLPLPEVHNPRWGSNLVCVQCLDSLHYMFDAQGIAGGDTHNHSALLAHSFPAGPPWRVSGLKGSA